MDSADDDFGELYVDVKVQASPLVTGGVGFVKSVGESESVAISDKIRDFEGTVKLESQGEMKNFGVVAKDSSPRVDACAVNLTEADEESEYSDSEDDLNIVLKDDDSKALPVARGSNNNNGGYAVADAVEASKPCSFQKPWTGRWCSMPNGRMVNGRVSMDASANNVWIDPSLGMPQCGYSFSHSWSRTSFDVVERKPWRNPGTEGKDFFNYGFNEQSWKDYCKPLGKAIEVGGGTLERIPSADLRGRPRDSDPDVVIEIPMTNDVEELSNKTSVDTRSPSIPSNEPSTSEELHSDNGNDFSSPDDTIKEEAVVGCQDEHTGSSSGEQSPPKENWSSREVTPYDKEVIEDEKEETCWNSDEVDPSSEERESSLGDHIRFSPTSSHSFGRNEDSETESSKGGATDDQRERSTPPRRTRIEEHEAISIKSEERSGMKHSRHRRSHEEPSTRHCERANHGVYRRVKHGTVKDASRSRTPDPDLGKKVSSRHGSMYRDSSKSWQNGPLLHSNREKRHCRFYPSVDHDRDRDHRFGWRNNKDSSQGRSFDHSNGYKYEVRHEEYNSRSSFNLSQRNSRSSFKEEEDRYGRQHYGREYGRQRSSDLAYESNKERNQHDWLRESYYQERIPVTEMDHHRYQSEYSSSHGRHNSRHSHENDLHWRRRDDYDYDFPCYRYEDGAQREESGIPFELAYRERHSFAEVGRREFQEYERNQEFSEINKRHHYKSDWHRDRFVSEKDDYKYRSQDALPSSLRDSWYTKGSRGDSWRDDTRDLTTTEAYNRQNNQFYKGAPRDGWTPDFVHNDHVSVKDRLTYEDDWVRRDRERYELADDIQCSMREVTHSEHPSYMDETLVRDIRMPIHNRISTKQRSGYLKSHIHETDERHHGSKKPRIDGHAFIKCQDPVDSIGRKGKLSNQLKRRLSKSNGEDTREEQDHQKPRKAICRNNEKAVRIRDLNDKEEGEIVEEAKNVNGIVINEERIQESLKKMEKRRERFQKTESVKTVVTTFESQTETDDTNQQRPIRKRRWCAS